MFTHRPPVHVVDVEEVWTAGNLSPEADWSSHQDAIVLWSGSSQLLLILHNWSSHAFLSQDDARMASQSRCNKTKM